MKRQQLGGGGPFMHTQRVCLGPEPEFCELMVCEVEEGAKPSLKGTFDRNSIFSGAQSQSDLVD